MFQKFIYDDGKTACFLIFNLFGLLVPFTCLQTATAIKQEGPPLLAGLLYDGNSQITASGVSPVLSYR